MSLEPASNGTPPPQTSDVSAIAGTLIESKPAVQEHAIQAAQNQAKADALLDKSGAKFDAAIHQTDATGNGVKTAGGLWAKKRGRKAGEPVIAGSRPKLAGVGNGSGPGAVATPLDQARMAGEQAAAAFIGLGMLLGGEEWLPVKVEGIDEQAHLNKVFGDYFVSKNMRDIPPGVALAIGLIGYAAPRCFRPVTKSRLGIAKAWVSDKVRRLYVWYVGRRGK